MTLLSIFLGALGAFFLYPYLVHMWYLLQARRHGLSTPRVIWSFPFGIPQFVQILRAAQNHRMNRRTLDVSLALPTMTGRSQLMGSFFVMTMDPENIKAVLATQFKDFGHARRYKYFFPLLGDGAFTLDGPGWQHTRAMLRPQFTREQISHVHIIEDHLQKIIQIYRNNNKEGYLDIQPFFYKLTLDSATEFLFGESTDLLSGGNRKLVNALEFEDAFNNAQEVLRNRSLAQNFYWLVNSANFRKWCQVCQTFTSSYVNLALLRTQNYNGEKNEKAEKGEKYIFLDELAKETRNPILLRDQALNILVAGRDTTASLLSWVFLMLARHPDVFEQLRSVILEHFGDGRDLSKVTFETLKRCDYLRYVINETLRLYPTVPNNFRYALKDTSLPRGGGPDESEPIFIPKGHMIMYSAYVLHRHPKLWGPDSGEFKPMRWANRKSTHPWDYLPFNGGPRICLGQQFALTEVSYTIVRMLQNFKGIDAAPSALIGEPKENSSLTLSVADGVPIRLIPV
ncbi:uncharacterized protein SAPINGB_P001153 [Magnusiomyces paraingens]|uniref:Cytochrome P450 n=1 Tax=Magnusiomyces paraingens TaxID=2606893 RepID=A0A5E8B633_9ASCO|nr:uncharacterized protein SAPINGB_P001153 [Saprochaete ingens]VVT46316.1 unnamed protein product [Saprochaete ingens]